MHATSPPSTHPIAVACALAAVVLASLALPSDAWAERWLPPVPGDVARPFSYAISAPFAAGAHRGVDIAAPPRAAVRAACTGRVVHAGRVAGRANVASMTCGARRVSYLPLATVTVRAGEMVRAGAQIGTVAAGHGGLHLGVRREDDQFGYMDPMALLENPSRPFAPAPRPAVPRRIPRSTVPRLAPRPMLARLAPQRAVPLRAERPVVPRVAPPPSALRHVAAPAASSPAPWPVWLGLALLLCGAAGSRTVAVRRRRCVRADPGATSMA